MPHKDVIATGSLAPCLETVGRQWGHEEAATCRLGKPSMGIPQVRVHSSTGIDLSGGSYDPTEPHLHDGDSVRGSGSVSTSGRSDAVPTGSGETRPPPIAGQRTPLPATAAPRPSMPARPTSSACDLGHVRWNTQKIRGRDREGFGSERGCCNHRCQSGGQGEVLSSDTPFLKESRPNRQGSLKP